MEEYKNDVDIGLTNMMEPSFLELPKTVEDLYVEKPIGKYEPNT